MPLWLPILLGFLTAVGPMSTDMYLPAFPAIDKAMGGIGSAQITLATWFCGLAIGQVTQGTLSDRYGRRGPLMIGTIIYTLASIGCALSTNLFELSTFRFLSALGGSASMVIPRAIVRDRADGIEAVRLMSRLMLVMGVTPILAPSLGGFMLAAGLSWHAIFWIAALYGAICSVLVWRLLPDTLPPAMRSQLGIGGVLHRFALIASDRSFLANALMGGWVTFSMFAYVGGSPPVFINFYHMSPPQYGLLFGVNASCYIFASQVNAKVVHRYGLSRTMTAMTFVFLASTILVTAMAFLQVKQFIFQLLPLTLMWGSLGFLSPNAAISALSRHAKRAASASALMGTMQFCLGALSSVTIGYLQDNTARPMAVMLLWGSLCVLGMDRFRQRLRERPAKAR